MPDPLKMKFARQVEEHLPRLRRYSQVLTRSRAEADDLVQNCLARAFAKQALWEPGTDLRAWLFTIMHHLHVNERPPCKAREILHGDRLAARGENRTGGGWPPRNSRPLSRYGSVARAAEASPDADPGERSRL